MAILDCIEYYMLLINKALEQSNSDHLDHSDHSGLGGSNNLRDSKEEEKIKVIEEDAVDLQEEEEKEDPDKNPPQNTVEYKKDDLYSFKVKESDKNNIWTIEQINIIHSISIELELQSAKNDFIEIQCLIDSIDKILEPKDAKFKLYMSENYKITQED